MRTLHVFGVTDVESTCSHHSESDRRHLSITQNQADDVQLAVNHAGDMH